MGGRFLNKRLTIQDGFSQGQGDGDPAAFFEGDTLKVTRPAAVEGNITGTGLTVNSVAIKGDAAITNAWKITYTWDMPAIAGVIGSTSALASQDVAMSGAAIADTIIAAPVGSLDLHLHWAAACSSANNVKLKAWYTGSTGALTPGNVPFKITCIKI